ncbi:SET domain-containing protein-lysine N-methyltransferase [Desulfobacterota bacterium M19]
MYYVSKSLIHGKGIFLSSITKKDVTIGIAFGHIRNTGSSDKDYASSELGKFVNHSDYPNLIAELKGSDIYYVTKKKIIAHNELTVNYINLPIIGKLNF